MSKLTDKLSKLNDRFTGWLVVEIFLWFLVGFFTGWIARG